jgi:hypothetical protein
VWIEDHPGPIDEFVIKLLLYIRLQQWRTILYSDQQDKCTSNFFFAVESVVVILIIVLVVIILVIVLLVIVVLVPFASCSANRASNISLDPSTSISVS